MNHLVNDLTIVRNLSEVPQALRLASGFKPRQTLNFRVLKQVEVKTVETALRMKKIFCAFKLSTSSNLD